MGHIETTAGGARIGELVYKVFRSQSELKVPFEHPSITFQHYLQKAGFAETYPIAFVDDLKVAEDAQKNGYGTAMLRQFEQECSDLGCGTGFLKVGFHDEAERIKNVGFYRKRGWTVVQLDRLLPYLAFRDLKNLG